jgi:hypothetical protein
MNLSFHPIVPAPAFIIVLSFFISSVWSKLIAQQSPCQSMAVEVVLMSFALSSRLMTSTNGTHAVETNLPQYLINLFRDKDPESSVIQNFEWRKYIKFGKDGEMGTFPFLSFLTNAEGIEAERNLDVFVKEVLIPLCIKTSAVVLCTPSKECSLGMSFGKAASFLAPTYEGYSAFEFRLSWALH